MADTVSGAAAAYPGAVFGRTKTSGKTPAAAAATTDHEVREGAKGRPTPKRREAEQRNRRPLGSPARAAAVRPGASKEEKKAAREAERKVFAEERALQRQALVTGDERYLPVRDKGVAKRFTRDYVDARRNAGELFIPVAMVILLSSLIPVAVVVQASLVALYALVLWVIVDSFLLRRKLNRITVDRFGDKATGCATYGMMRALQIRRTRLPKPQVKRGEFPV